MKGDLGQVKMKTCQYHYLTVVHTMVVPRDSWSSADSRPLLLVISSRPSGYQLRQKASDSGLGFSLEGLSILVMGLLG